MPYSVLVVDDEELTLRTVSRGLRQEGFDVFTAASGEDALRIFADEKPDLTLLDIVLPGIDGVEVLRRIKQADPAAIILMMSAYHMVDRAVEAMKLGAYDYLIKPFHLADMIVTLHRAGEMLALRVRVRDDVELARGRYDFGKVVTHNDATRRMLEIARKAAESDHTTILIEGESGTGKSVLAKAIHYASPRASMPLLELNCAALPDTLLESELFGFEPGAFTDARRHHVRQRAGQALKGPRRILLPAPRRHAPHQSQRPPHRRHQRQPQRSRRPRLLPRRPLLPPQRRSPLHPPLARSPRGHRPARPRTPPALQSRAEKKVHRGYARRRRTPAALSLARQYPRAQKRDRAHHDPLARGRHRCRFPSRRNPRLPPLQPARPQPQPRQRQCARL